MKMHAYALESRERIYVPLFLAAASILAAFGLHTLVDALKTAPPWWLDAPSVVGFYELFHWSYDKRLWKNIVLRRLRLANTPDLNGNWKGYLTSSYEKNAVKHDVVAKITQTWTKLAVVVNTPTSKSRSVVAALSIEESGGAILSYEYINEPQGSAKPTMEMHRGFASLSVSEKAQTLNGDYFNGRGRQTFGIVHLQRNS